MAFNRQVIRVYCESAFDSESQSDVEQDMSSLLSYLQDDARPKINR
jgi:hypothetical protein